MKPQRTGPVCLVRPMLTNSLVPFVWQCVHDQNGNHVIQKCIEVLSLKTKESPEYASFLLPQVRAYNFWWGPFSGLVSGM